MRHMRLFIPQETKKAHLQDIFNEDCGQNVRGE